MTIYIYQHDDLSERVSLLYAEFRKVKKRDGTLRKDVDFRWFDMKYFTDDDNSKHNNWELLGF